MSQPAHNYTCAARIALHRIGWLGLRKCVPLSTWLLSDSFLRSSQVPLAVIEEALAAANWAPTHGKTEPWRFVVVGPVVTQDKML